MERLLDFAREHGIEIALAVFASVMAVIQFYDSRKLKRNAEEISYSLSTRFIGLFPHNLSDIDTVVRSAKQGVKILVDVAAYGHYSNPAAFNRLAGSLRAQILKHRPVKMLVHDAETYKRYREGVFPETEFDKERTEPRFKEFFEAKQGDIPATWREFQDRLAAEQKRHFESFVADGVEILPMKKPSQIMIWLADDKEAVFSFLRETHHEVAFRTRDGKFITELNELFETAWKDATDYHP